MAALSRAKLMVAAMPFDRWRGTLGSERQASPDGLIDAQRLAAHVDWAARFVPFEAKCLHRAMALSWALRRRAIGHEVVFAVRPREMRGSGDDLHAWVEVGGSVVIGDLPGPWLETLRTGA